MARRWTKEEEKYYRDELVNLYYSKNLSMHEVAKVLNIKSATVFDRLRRLRINTVPHLKKGYRNVRKDIRIPDCHDANLAEFFGIMLGDGHLSHFQVTVTLGTKEYVYVQYVKKLMEKIFKVPVKISERKFKRTDNKHYTVYFGSTVTSQWLKTEGLVENKVKNQVDVPKWIFENNIFMERFLRGFFDTDGSVYKLRHGIQIGLTNRSLPMLKSLQLMLKTLEYRTSEISGFRLYITKKQDLKRFFKEIKPKNPKHTARFQEYLNASVA
ncbi:MAG: hypothetical protein COV34_01425 [Candidatus Zambryskibacteria bacterium CG10_big_fil_rev_8_21_14_0_10_42_12]|uniref:DOD-type homing endonuclease domain-containing protein n=1 Tax=Candidatus Zambryskibacteria bacterium CG10_big_fil_rev_8_21_14_0_10_42_12 TaxID=1975115 RepID=A0A2H0QWQ9_9BACT|nr:MAG: hypothetical protein COV34_01425 [Candidatus Zambryskibacteria bacterium CG10_big_fil_rev_8_21_14_0_10_42_12]